MKVAVVALVTLVLFSTLGNFNAQSIIKNDNKEHIVVELFAETDDLNEKFPAFCSGFDASGRPIWIIEYGKWDLKSVVNGNDPEKMKEFEDYFDALMCKVQKSIKIKSTDEKPVKEWGCVFDMMGYSNKQLNSAETVTYTIHLSKKFEKAAKNMEYGFLINMDAVAQVLLQLVKPALGTTLQRTEIFKKEKDKYIPAILNRVPKESLPEQYGGYDNFTAYPVEDC